MDKDPIPLWDGELGASEIIQDEYCESSGTGLVRPRRVSPRKGCEDVHICFSPNDPSGLVEHVECPVVDMSATGFAIEFDQKLKTNVKGYISYRTVSQRPVRVSCSVRQCVPLENGHYLLGIKLDRTLRAEERMLAKVRPGREVSPGVRARKLRASTNVQEATEEGAEEQNQSDP